METMRVKCEPSEGNTNPFFVINVSDFDPERHEPFDAEDVAKLPEAVRAALTVEDEGGEDDPDSMTVAQLKEALQAKGIEFAPNARKADLVAALTAADD